MNALVPFIVFVYSLWFIVTRRNCRGGNGRMEDWIIFFAWGGSNMWHPPVLVIEAFNDGAK